MRRTVLISGCAGTLGLEIARRYLQAGDAVVGIARSEASTVAIRAALGSQPGLSLHGVELSNGDALNSQINAILSAAADIDVLINNAGTHYPSAMEDADIDRCRQLFEVNLWSPMLLAQAVLPAMRAKKRGHIITIGSLSAMAGLPCDGIYGASKAALRAAFEALRHEIAQFNINVSMVVSGSFQSGLQNKMSQIDHAADSVYAPLYESWVRSFDGSANTELSAADVADKVLAISRSDTPDFCYPVGSVANAVVETLEKMSDSERQAAIRGWSA